VRAVLGVRTCSSCPSRSQTTQRSTRRSAGRQSLSAQDSACPRFCPPALHRYLLAVRPHPTVHGGGFAVAIHRHSALEGKGLAVTRRQLRCDRRTLDRLLQCAARYRRSCTADLIAVACTSANLRDALPIGEAVAYCLGWYRPRGYHGYSLVSSHSRGHSLGAVQFERHPAVSSSTGYRSDEGNSVNSLDTVKHRPVGIALLFEQRPAAVFVRAVHNRIDDTRAVVDVQHRCRVALQRCTMCGAARCMQHVWVMQ
jgi:hypothetical protein